jgi:colanic acid/amylovoran biosynthesis glycosyltransferase
MRIGYFTNQYPAPSHTFIRREIVALEERGHDLRRYAIRQYKGELKDRDDLLEAVKTSHILAIGLLHILIGCARTILSNPSGVARAFTSAMRFASVSKRGYLMHLIYLMEAITLARWCARDRIDHLHVHFGTNPATVAALACEISQIPFSFTVHGPEEFDQPEDLDLGRKTSKASFVVTVSSFGRSQLMRWASPELWEKINVVHCGIDDCYREERYSDVSLEPRLVCVGRFAKQKGQMLLIQAADRLRNKGINFKLILIGDGPLRPDLEAEIERLSLREIVTLTGWLPQQALRDELARARAMVLPSFAEGLPVVLMESMALKRPAISTYIAGIPELVTPENGWLVPAGDIPALADAMGSALAASGEELVRMGNAGRRRVLDRHDIARSAALLDVLITSAIKTSARQNILRSVIGEAVPEGSA